jgi:hypothetical protein
MDPKPKSGYVRFLAPIGLFFVTVAAIVLWTIATSPRSATCPAQSCPAPRTITRTFRELETLEDLSHSADSAWEATFNTPKGGFLWVKHNETMNEAWGVSMFHAIHCLGLIRQAVQESGNNTHAISSTHHEANSHTSRSVRHTHGGMDRRHIGHCFSYIAQVSTLLGVCA